MFDIILKNQENFLADQKAYRNFENELKEMTQILNNDSIVTLSGLRHCGKSKLIAQFILKAGIQDEIFYFNSELDPLGIIKNENDLITLIEVFMRSKKVPKIIILQNCNSIKGIKSFISTVYKSKKYKLIIVGNSIKIEGVKNIQLFPLSYQNIKKEHFNYGGIPEVRILPNSSYKNFLLSTLKQDIISREIIEDYSVKNIEQYYKILSYIATSHRSQSLREMHRSLGEIGIDISLLTLIDYINAALNTQILQRMYAYDFKGEKMIGSKAKYYFGDAGIEHAFSFQNTSLENILFLEFLMRRYEITSGINGKFEFEFSAKKGGNHICIALAENIQDKNEIRKIARKLGKLDKKIQKFVIINKTPDLLMRKFEEDGVKLIEFQELFQYI